MQMITRCFSYIKLHSVEAESSLGERTEVPRDSKALDQSAIHTCILENIKYSFISCKLPDLFMLHLLFPVKISHSLPLVLLCRIYSTTVANHYSQLFSLILNRKFTFNRFLNCVTIKPHQIIDLIYITPMQHK